MNLIISSRITSDPPSEGLYFRYLTMVAKEDLKFCVVVESEKESIDRHYKFLKEKGWYDYVEDFVVPEWRIEGVRIDPELNYPLTIRAPYIKYENTLSLLGQIKSMRKNLVY